MIPILLEAHNPGPMTGRGNNTYLIAGSPGAALIDAGVGHPEHLAEIERALASRRAHLELVLVTHGHGDHAGGAPALAAAYPAAAFAKYPWPDEDSRYPVAWRALTGDEMVEVGGERFRVVHTPGHSPDHVVFWQEPSRTAFTGDLVVAGGSVMIHTSRGGNLAEYLASLERVLALEPGVLLPAHGPAIDDPAAVIHAYLDHRRMRERQVIAALGAGRATVQAIAESIYDGLDAALLPAACENVRAHLDKLQADGVARDDAGRWTLS